MRAYEVVYILDASLERPAVDAKLEAFHAVLNGQVSTVDHWGVRKLAYPIAKAETAYYAVVHVEADPTALPEFERLLRLDEETMRYLIVVNEGQPTSGASVLADPPARDVAEDGEASSDGGSEEALADGAVPDGADGADGPENDESVAADVPSDSTDADADAGTADAESVAGAAGDGTADAKVAEDGSTEEEAAEDDAPPRSGPPEFSGARGRRRRHEGPPIVLLNYKDVTTLSRFLTEQGRILPKRTTKVTARFQRRLGAAIKRARYLALIPYMKDHGA